MTRIGTIPHSEVAMHCGLAGQTLRMVEEDHFLNGNPIPPEHRFGCFVIAPNGARIPMLKGEAGWDEAQEVES